MGKLIFEAAAVRRVVEHALANPPKKAKGKDSPAILLVHDDGVYLMSAGEPRDIAEEGETRCFVAHARGTDPKKDEDWWDRAKELVGGDDFGEPLPTPWPENILKLLDAGAETITINVGKNTISLVERVAKPKPKGNGKATVTEVPIEGTNERAEREGDGPQNRMPGEEEAERAMADDPNILVPPKDPLDIPEDLKRDKDKNSPRERKLREEADKARAKREAEREAEREKAQPKRSKGQIEREMRDDLEGKRPAKGKAKGKDSPLRPTPGPNPKGSKVQIIAELLLRKGGTTGREILNATGWPTVSVPQQAKAAGLNLRKEKVDGVTRYYGSK